MRALISRVLIALAALTMLVIVPVGAAHAQWPEIPTGQDCLRPPDAESPTDGLASAIDPGPVAPPAGDPFAPQAKASIYDTYGYAGFKGVVFDPGCMNTSQFYDAPNSASDTLTGISVVAIAATVRLARLLMDGTFGSIFAPLVTFASDTIGARIFMPLISIGILATGLYFLLRAKFGDVKGTMRQSVGTLVIVCAGLACASWALTIGAAVDSGITKTVAATNHAMMIGGAAHGQRDAADVIAANLVSQTLYTTWQHKTFGNNPQAAAEFGPELFKAGALTRAEQNQINQHPETAKTVLDKKKDQYKQVAKRLEKKYPQAYRVLAGNDTTGRVGWALAGLLGALAGVFMLAYTLYRVAYAITVARIGIAITPGLAIVAQHPRWQHHALGLLGWIAQCCLSALGAAVIFAVVLVGGIGGIMDPGTNWHPLVKVFAMVIATVVLWKLMKRLGFGHELDAARKLANKAQRRFSRHQEQAERAHQQKTTTTTLIPPTPLTAGAWAAPAAPATLTATLTPVPQAAPTQDAAALPAAPATQALPAGRTVIQGHVITPGASGASPATLGARAHVNALTTGEVAKDASSGNPVQISPEGGTEITAPTLAAPKALPAGTRPPIADHVHDPRPPATPTPGGQTRTAATAPASAELAQSIWTAPPATTTSAATVATITPSSDQIFTPTTRKDTAHVA